MKPPIKLSSRPTNEFWEIPVLFEDEHLLALDKPSGLLTSPDRYDLQKPNLMTLLHAGIADGKPWARERGITYLSNAHRLDAETSGVILLAKTKEMLIALADLFGSEKPESKYLALVRGTLNEDQFEVDAKIAPHPAKPGVMHIDQKAGKRAKTIFTVQEKLPGHTLFTCQPMTLRTHQIRVHARYAGLPLVGDEHYGGKPLWLSRLKREYRLKPGREERPLISRAALHAEHLSLAHPVTNEPVAITAPLPKDLKVALKYLRQNAGNPPASDSEP